MLIAFLFQACLVHTNETIRVCYFMERLMEQQRPLMLVGTTGTGKSVLVGAKLASLNAEDYLVKNVPFNYYTTSAMLQGKGFRGHGRGWGCLSGPVTGHRDGAMWQALAQLDSAFLLTIPFSLFPSFPSHNTSVPLLLHTLAQPPLPILFPHTLP